MAEDKYKAQRAYDQRHNLLAKSYRLNKELTEEFAKACSKNGISQAAQLSKMMQDYIDEQKNS